MATTHWPVYSDMAKEHYGRGEEQGQVEDRRDALLTIARKRGLALSDAQRSLIADTSDLDLLKAWFESAITADDADDIFT